MPDPIDVALLAATLGLAGVPLFMFRRRRYRVRLASADPAIARKFRTRSLYQRVCLAGIRHYSRALKRVA